MTNKKYSIRLISLVLIFALATAMGNLAFAESNSTSSTLLPEQQENIQREANLKRLFPEYTQQIEEANETSPNSLSRSVLSNEKDVVFCETRGYDEEKQYSLILYSDNTYTAVESQGLLKSAVGWYQWSGGSTSSGSGYSSYTNAVLTVWQSGALTNMIVTPFSYTLVNGGNSYISNTGTITYSQTTSAWETAPFYTTTAGPTSTKMNANSAGPAYAKYTGGVVIQSGTGSYYSATSYVEIQVRSSSVAVLLNGVQI